MHIYIYIYTHIYTYIYHLVINLLILVVCICILLSLLVVTLCLYSQFERKTEKHISDYIKYIYYDAECLTLIGQNNSQQCVLKEKF